MGETNEKMLKIWRWWSIRVRNKSQLMDHEEWTEGFDYFNNDDGWLTWVATEVLLMEYNRDHFENPLEHADFTYNLRKMIILSRIKDKKVKITVGEMPLTTKRSGILFKARRWYESRLYSECYYVCFR